MQKLIEKVAEAPRGERELAPILYTIEGAMAVSGFTRSRIYEEISAGRIHAVKAGRRTMCVADSLRALLANLPRANIRLGSKRAA